MPLTTVPFIHFQLNVLLFRLKLYFSIFDFFWTCESIYDIEFRGYKIIMADLKSFVRIIHTLMINHESLLYSSGSVRDYIKYRLTISYRKKRNVGFWNNFSIRFEGMAYNRNACKSHHFSVKN